MHPAGTRLYGAGGTITVKVLNPVTDAFLGFIVASGLIDNPQGAAVSPDGSRVYITNFFAGRRIVVADTATNAVIGSSPTDVAVRGVAVHPDGTRVYAVYDDSPARFVSVMETATFTVPTTLALSTSSAREIAVHPDGTRAYVTGSVELAVIHTTTDTLATEVALGGDLIGVAVHPDGDRLYVVARDFGTVRVVDVATLAVIDTIPAGTFPHARGHFIGPKPVCGDGAVTFPEECDDGNALHGDCCSSSCTLDAAGAPCTDDGEQCTDDVCDGAGACEHPHRSGACDDANACTVDDACVEGTCLGDYTCNVCQGCAPAVGCVAEIAAGCRAPTVPGASVLAVADRAGSDRDVLTWKWRKGAETAPADFGAPPSTTDYTLCVYDESGGTPSLAARVPVPAGGPWAPTATGFLYKDAALSSAGAFLLRLKAGAAGRAAAVFKGRGASLPTPALPLTQDPRVTVQLRRDDGAACWEASYGASRRSTATVFRAVSD
jgi:cysteine-rich repeat protein/YVTN family beta-propeller protein